MSINYKGIEYTNACFGVGYDETDTVNCVNGKCAEITSQPCKEYFLEQQGLNVDSDVVVSEEPTFNPNEELTKTEEDFQREGYNNLPEELKEVIPPPVRTIDETQIPTMSKEQESIIEAKEDVEGWAPLISDVVSNEIVTVMVDYLKISNSLLEINNRLIQQLLKSSEPLANTDVELPPTEIAKAEKVIFTEEEPLTKKDYPFDTYPPINQESLALIGSPTWGEYMSWIAGHSDTKKYLLGLRDRLKFKKAMYGVRVLRKVAKEHFGFSDSEYKQLTSKYFKSMGI